MNHIDCHKRSTQLKITAIRLGYQLPAYPEHQEMIPVIRAIRKETGCTREAAIHAIVAGVLRPKRKLLKEQS